MSSDTAFGVHPIDGDAPSSRVSDEVHRILSRATEVDGTAPLSEQAVKAVDAGENVVRLVATEGDRVVGYAGIADGMAEAVVDPSSRGRGIGRELVSRALDIGSDARIWAHGNIAAAQSVAARLELKVVRELLQMRRASASPDLPDVVVPEGITLRTYRGHQDDAELLRVNNAAFSWHPEQGGWTDRDIASRRDEPWFDPAGLFLAFEEGSDHLLGFHWTKVHPAEGAEPAIGEVYVVGIDPQSQGRGLGRVLTLAGLHYLRSRELGRIMLYVEADNTAAVHTYTKLGFTNYHVDAAYARTV
ncbi:mycothiol synthase [Rhodococcus sp. 06-412-2C]|uniref:mycothiol synthase n=1 Tax=unclassified Rhodococcus (in: high G+C Gram-positive bacteria) TaxID=192944 RepID=UPI000B9BCF07|nr:MULTISPECIES: mycothiol synthase [unclassified Rhodococcus (in: high G+C Gram-positive bacteria)]OZC84164.1 mycothiol synthase [Rhodococcus sp. 06-412-2C]OZC94352.1 mycothiol synthase [Rhodococcus sp. 06-412-2B]